MFSRPNSFIFFTWRKYKRKKSRQAIPSAQSKSYTKQSALHTGYFDKKTPYLCRMIIHTAEFTCSYVDWKKCPKEHVPEYAFIGRSNVGKSSLINTLTERKGLAKISNTPGKTQCINFFSINKEWNLVDLPGYGYAKTSKKNRELWMKFTKDYLRRREQLQNVFVLIDGRIDPQNVDLDFIQWLGENGIPFSLVFTKNDKPKKTFKNIENFKETLLETWEELPVNFITSSVTNVGREDILAYIDQVNEAIANDIDLEEE